MPNIEKIGYLQLIDYKDEPADNIYFRMLGGGQENVFEIAEALEAENDIDRFDTWEGLSLLHKHGIVSIGPDCEVRFTGNPFN